MSLIASLRSVHDHDDDGDAVDLADGDVSIIVFRVCFIEKILFGFHLGKHVLQC